MGGLVNLVIAFIASLVAGFAMAVQMAFLTQAREEFALVFTMLAFIAIMSLTAFAIAQWRGDRRTRIKRMAGALALLISAIALGLASMSFSNAGSFEGVRRDLPIIAGIVAPSLIVIFVQWLIVGWRARRIAAAA